MANTRRTHASPASFTQEIEDIIDSLDDLIPLYADVDEYVYGSVDNPIGQTGRISGGGSPNDPTASTVAQQEGNKAQLKRVAEDLKRVKAIIDGTEKNNWNGIRERLLKVYDPREHEPLAAFRSSGSGGGDRRSRALEGKLTRFSSRLKRLEKLARRVS